MLTEPPGRQRPIKPRELTAILGAFTRNDSRFARRVTAAALLTGCRLSEILSLREGQVDLVAHTITLRDTKQNRVHQIAVTPPLAALIRDALADRKGDKHAGHVFVNRFGRAYTQSGFSKHFANVTERAGVPDITFHDLRRHVGTVLINSGERLEVVSKLLGHSSVAVTQRSYAHLTTDATRAAFATLATRLPDVAPVLPPALKRPVANRSKSA
jgi:integrase